MTEKEEALIETEKRPPLKKRVSIPAEIVKPMEQLCFDTGVFTLELVKKIPMYLSVAIAFIWVGLLLFCGTMITHDYSIFKNLITILGTVVAIAFIVFIVLLFSMLLSKLVGLVTNIITEIQYRI